MMSHVDSPRSGRWLAALTLFTFFFLLGSRSLNEPDEGRYAEIAREMIELGDWLVPHLWYEPHVEKPSSGAAVWVQRNPAGAQVVVPHAVPAKSIVAIRRVKQLVGWTEVPELPLGL